jgi:hypothetical protein
MGHFEVVRRAVAGSLRRPEEERLVRGHSGARTVANRERHGAHTSRDVATREDAPHGGLLRLVGPEEGAERAFVKRTAERLGERESGPRAGLHPARSAGEVESSAVKTKVCQSSVKRRRSGSIDRLRASPTTRAWPRMPSSRTANSHLPVSITHAFANEFARNVAPGVFRWEDMR